MPTGRELFSEHFIQLRQHVLKLSDSKETLAHLLDHEYASAEEFLQAFDAWRMVEEAKLDFKPPQPE